MADRRGWRTALLATRREWRAAYHAEPSRLSRRLDERDAMLAVADDRSRTAGSVLVASPDEELIAA